MNTATSMPESDRATTCGAGDPVETALARNRDTLKALFPLPELPALPGLPGQRNSQAAANPARARRRAPGAAATGAALAGLAVVAAVTWWLDPAYRYEAHASAIGERQQRVLADGSRITLDTATTLRVAWHLRSRRVELKQGQAQFEVSPVAAWPFGLSLGLSLGRPFEVAAGATHVRVVGTVFGVRRQGQRVTVTVAEGRVQVSVGAPGDTQPAVLLGPGQQVSTTPGVIGAAPVLGMPQASDVAAASAWQRGQLVFDRTPLRDALAEVQRYRSARIVLQDDPAHPNIGKLQVTGVFETAHTDQWLALLPRILPVTVLQSADGSVVVRAR